MDAPLGTVATDFPPIILFVDDDRDTREMYSAFFESSGMWTATAADPDEAIEAIEELRPDLVVTDIGFSGSPLGVSFVHRMKERPQTQHTPVIVLSGQSAEQIPVSTRHEADLLLIKPVLPDNLLARTRELLARSTELRKATAALREKSTDVTRRARSLVAKSTRLRERSGAVIDRAAESGVGRRCPECDRALEWLERGSVAGGDYDYYRWCVRGCGLYCYDRHGSRWVKLA